MTAKDVLKKKSVIIPLLFVLMLVLLNSVKHESVFYIPFNIPGNQMAATIPPFGIFIESEFKNENPAAPCSILKHEKIHWNQYRRMGLVMFYANYLDCYMESGRINNWMEKEAREPCANNLK